MRITKGFVCFKEISDMNSTCMISWTLQNEDTHLCPAIEPRSIPGDRLDILPSAVFHKLAIIVIKWAGSCENVSYAICEQQRRRSAPLVFAA